MQPFVTDERMYQAGLLRIVMKMRTENTPLEELLQDMQKKLRLEPAGFRRYVSLHLQEAVVAVGKRSRS